MEIKPFAACRTSEGWVPVEVESSSQEGVRYTVLSCPWGNASENICECPGYFHRGVCKHQRIAMDRLCGWTEEQVTHSGEPRFVQDEVQRKNRVCPRCGGPTVWKLEIVDD